MNKYFSSSNKLLVHSRPNGNQKIAFIMPSFLLNRCKVPSGGCLFHELIGNNQKEKDRPLKIGFFILFAVLVISFKNWKTFCVNPFFELHWKLVGFFPNDKDIGRKWANPNDAHCIMMPIVILVRIFPEFSRIRTRITPNTDSFYAVAVVLLLSLDTFILLL